MRALMFLIAVLVSLSGCTSVAYVENGNSGGSQCESTVSIDDNGLKAINICRGDSREQ